MRFRGFVDEQAKFVPEDRARWHATLSRLRDKRVEVTIGRERKIRSLSANRYYWGWIMPILAEYTGYSAQDLHEALKARILGCNETPFGPVPRGTSTLDETQFSDFVMHVKAEAAQLGCYLPEPEDA